MKYLATFCLILGLMGCGSDGGNKVTSPSAFFGKVNAAVSSASVLSQTLAVPTCISGSPTSSTPGQSQYPGEQVYCSLNTNTASPDTIQGSYFLVSTILCAIEKTISFEYGSAPKINNGIVIAETDDCFGSGGFDVNGDGGISGSTTLSIAEVGLPSGSAFDFYIGFQFASTYTVGGVDQVQFFLKDSDGLLAARIYEPIGNGIFDFTINSNDGSFSYENKDFGNQRHIRLWVDGTVSGTGAFSSVEAAKFVYSQGDSTGSNVVSIMNFTTAGEQFDHYQNTSQLPGFTVIPQLPHNLDFYSWTGRPSVTTDLVDAAPVNYSTTFNMSF